MTIFSDLSLISNSYGVIKRTLASLLVAGLLCMSLNLRAQGCPEGTYPWSGNGVFTYLPDPNFQQQQTESTPQKIQPEKWVDRWEAIATDADTGSLGTATEMPSRRSAEKTALSDCHAKGGKNCKLQISNANGCMAMVVGNKLFNTNNGATEDEAIKKGMTQCTAIDSSCRVYYSACSLPQRMQ